MKTNSLLSLSLSVLLITGLFAPSVNALGQPLPEAERCRFREEIEQKTLPELAQQLEVPLHPDKKMLIIKELGKRKSRESETLLARLVQRTTQKIQRSGGRSPESEMLLACTLVELARVRSSEVGKNYIAELEKLLSTGNSFVQTAVALELGGIASTKARDILSKYETRRNISPVVKTTRLKVDYWNFNDEDFVRAVLKSAQQQIARGDIRVVAERTILIQRGMYEALRASSLVKEISDPSLPSQDYLRFLKEIHEGLRRCEDRYYPGFSSLVDLYDSRNSNAVDELRKVYLDGNSYWRYREKAYELYLTLEMEQSELTGREAALRHLLSNLTSTGEGHSSDWKNGVKTLRAIKDVAIVKKLTRYGEDALPYIEQELNKVSPTEEKRRYEALSYVKKVINLDLDRKREEEERNEGAPDLPSSSSAAKKVVETREPKFSRPEERGEDFSPLATVEVVKRFAASKDKIELRKAAKVLGDRSMAGTLHLSGKEKRDIEKIVIGYLQQAKAKTSNERVEAKQQIERLWHVAVPVLLANVNSKEPAIAELAIKSLILMRDETIIKALIEKARTTDDEYTKAMVTFTLKKMKEQRKSLIAGRKCLDEEESKVLYDRLIAPAFNELE